jgi:hypothetical protein
MLGKLISLLSDLATVLEAQQQIITLIEMAATDRHAQPEVVTQ